MGAEGGSISGITVFLVAAGICYCYCKKKCCWESSEVYLENKNENKNEIKNKVTVHVAPPPPPAQPIIMPMPMMYQSPYANTYGQPMPQMHQMPQYQNDNIYQPQRNPRDFFNATQ